MTTFNIISYNSGIVRGTIKADSYDSAFKTCLDKNVNVYDDYFLETVEETRKHDSVQGRTIYLTSDND